MSEIPENEKILTKWFDSLKIYYFHWKPKQHGMKEVYNLIPSTQQPFGNSVNEKEKIF